MEIDTGQPAESGWSKQLVLCETGVLGLAQVLRSFGLRDQPEIVREYAETLADVAGSASVPGKNKSCALDCPYQTMSFSKGVEYYVQKAVAA